MDARDISHLYHALDDEVKRTRIGQPSRIVFRLLEGVSYLLPLALSAAYLLDAVGPRLGQRAHLLIDETTAFLGGLVLPLLAAIAALFLANLPLFVKARRQWLLSRRLLTLRLLDHAMLPPPRVRPKHLVLLAPLGFMMLFLYGLGAPSDAPGRRLMALFLLVGWPLALLLIDNLLRRLRGLLGYFEEVRALRSELADAANGSERPPFSPLVLDRIADVQRLRRLRSRAEAITQEGSRPTGSYAVSKSESASAVLRKLGDAERLRIEKFLEDLVSRREGSAEAPKSGPPSTLHVEGTGWQLVYEVDTATRTIHILAIRSQQGFS